MTTATSASAPKTLPTVHPSVDLTVARNCTAIATIHGTILGRNRAALMQSGRDPEQVDHTVDDKPIDAFDDLFEPFELEGEPEPTPEPTQQRARRIRSEPVPGGGG